MLNFINNKFVKIFLSKTVVLSNLVCDIFCICSEKNNKEIIDNAEIKDKKNTGYCGRMCEKGDSDQSYIDTVIDELMELLKKHNHGDEKLAVAMAVYMLGFGNYRGFSD